jgi:MFS superfamily sulfate permease-like transporter
MFLTGALQFVPTAALGAVLIMAALSLLDLNSLRHFWTVNRIEFLISIIATVGVIRIGALKAILFVVVLSLLRFVQIIARPRTETLGVIPGVPGFHALDRHKDAIVLEGLLLFRFNGPVVFFNADYFKRETLTAVARAGGVRWLVLDMMPITQIDITGIDALVNLDRELERAGITLMFAGRRSETANYLQSQALTAPVVTDRYFPTMRKALRAYCLMAELVDPTREVEPAFDTPDVGDDDATPNN